MSSPVLTIAEGMKEKNQNKTKIGVGSVVKENAGYMGENTREGRIRSMSKYVVGFVHDEVGKNILLIQFKYGKKKQMSSSSLVFLSLKEEFGKDDSLYNSPKNNKLNC